MGVKGRTYALSVEDKNHRVQSQDVTIPADAGAQQNIDITFGRQQNANKTPARFCRSLHVFKQDDDLALAGAAVTIIAFNPISNSKADNEGDITFTVPEGEAYLIMANRDSYSGMYSGIADNGPVVQVATTRKNNGANYCCQKTQRRPGIHAR